MINFMDLSEKNITGPVNLGNENEFTVLNFREIINITNTNSKIIFEELPSDDPRQRKPDISYAKKIIN